MNNNCIFCEKATSKSEIIWENKFFYSMFDSFPVSPGHALIIPKSHIVDVLSLSPEMWVNLQQAIREIIFFVESSDLKTIYSNMLSKHISDTSDWFINKTINHPRINTKPDAYNHGVNDGTAAGRTVDHLHWHIIPRYTGDMVDPRGGVRYIIPNMGNYKIPR